MNDPVYRMTRRASQLMGKPRGFGSYALFVYCSILWLSRRCSDFHLEADAIGHWAVGFCGKDKWYRGETIEMALAKAVIAVSRMSRPEKTLCGE
jgi:hypothetical protein